MSKEGSREGDGSRKRPAVLKGYRPGARYLGIFADIGQGQRQGKGFSVITDRPALAGSNAMFHSG